MGHRILKQLIPTDTFSEDPSWAKRQVWVSKLNSDDDVDEFETLEEAEIRKAELESLDPTNRVYKIIAVY